MCQQAYQLRESDESKFYAILEILDIKPDFLTQMTTEDYEPSNHYLDYSCPFCQASCEDNPCINCSSLFCHK
jgi:hypothetical protein